MRPMVVHFSGGTEVTVETDAEPSVVFEALSSEGEWLVVEGTNGQRHYLAIRTIAYLTFGNHKGVGFA